MNLQRMRKVDYLIGMPLTLVLSLYHSLIGRFFRRRRGGSVRRICFVELTEAGTTVLAYGALKRAAAAFPDADHYWLIFANHVAGVEMVGVIPAEKIIAIRTSSLPVLALDCLKAIHQLRKLRIDATVDMELFTRISSILAYLTRAPIRVGFDRGEMEGLFRGNYLTHRVAYNPHQHIALNLLALVEALIEDTPAEEPATKAKLALDLSEAPRFQPDEALQARAEEILAESWPETPPETRRIVLFSTHAGALSLRGWPLANYVELAQRLLAHAPDLQIGLVGLPEASNEAEELLAAVDSPRCRSLIGKTRSLQELVAVYWRSRLLITSDGGPGQFAALSPMPAIVLFGPETPTLYRPLGPQVKPLFAGLSCSPCFSAYNHRGSRCTFNRCLHEITVDQVWQAARPLLDDRDLAARHP